MKKREGGRVKKTTQAKKTLCRKETRMKGKIRKNDGKEKNKKVVSGGGKRQNAYVDENKINTNIKRQRNDDVREEEEKEEAYGSKETTLQRDKK